MMDTQKIAADLADRLTHSNIKINEPLKHYTYTKTGGNADVYLTVKTLEDTAEAIKYCKENNVPVTFLGNGSNVIIRDGGIRGVVFNLLDIRYCHVNDKELVVGSGYPIIQASRDALENELRGLEFACGIPGSVGGAIYMNAGAYIGEVKDCIKEVKAIDQNGNIRTLNRDELELDYRTSIFQRNDSIIMEATFQLEYGDKQEIKAIMDDLTEKRESKQPLEYPSCGSVFQRPPGNFAGKLIQDAGLQGYRIGGVEVSKKHAGFMVNVDGGTASDYEDLIKYVQEEVAQQFGVELNREVRIIGEKL